MFNWLYWIFGKILFGIDWAIFHVFGIHNIGLCVIFFTIIVYLLMYPLNSKQQKSTRLMSKINPELQEIQKKYKNKRDQASQMKMNEETQALYAKYGISPFGGCLPLLISFPIMICLYRVIYSMGDYVAALNSDEAANFLGLNMKQTPMAFYKDPNHPYGWLAFLVPVLAMALQFLNTKVLQNSNQNTTNEQGQMQQSMKMMNYFMPLMSGFFCLSLNMGIGLYWIVGSLFRIIQAIIVNKKIDDISMDELIEKNKEKAAKKNKKREEMNRQMNEYAKTRTASIKKATSYENKSDDESSISENVKVNKDFKPGSIAGYANMLSGKDKNGGK